MNILIIAKIYHGNNARAIQIQRVVSALIKHTNNRYILITEGDENINFKSDKLTIINILNNEHRFMFAKKIFNGLICELFCIKRNNFIKKALDISEQLIINTKIETLLTVSTPFDSHLVGYEIKDKHPNIKWVTFFSDLWPLLLLPHPHKRRKLFSNIELILMKKILDRCDVLLTPSQYSLEILNQNFKTNTLLKTIPHCMDEKFNSTPNNIQMLDGYIVHAGYLQKERINKSLVMAIVELAQEEPKFKGLIHLGRYDISLKKLIIANKCKNIHLFGHLPEELSSLIQEMAGISLIIEAPMKRFSPFIPSKITDCIKTSKKIIAITPQKSFLSDLSKKTTGLFTCEYEKESIKISIKKALYATSYIDKNAICIFYPENIAKNYIDILSTNESTNNNKHF